MPAGLLAEGPEGGHAIRGAEKAGLLLQESTAAAAELRKLAAKGVGVESADFRPAPAGTLATTPTPRFTSPATTTAIPSPKPETASAMANF